MAFNKQDALSLVSHHRRLIANQIGFWAARSSSVLKVISGDFRPGRASVGMDGLMLRNRGNALEMIPFDQILAERFGRPLRDNGFLAGIERLIGRPLKPSKRGPKPAASEGHS